MTDRFKGVLVTFDREIREDEAKVHIDAIRMIRGVATVKPYIAYMEDHMMYHRGYTDGRKKMFELLVKDSQDPHNMTEGL